jgi:uncharacterized protein (TIGR02145 family)
MKKVLNLFVLVCFLAGVAAITSCKKTEVPTLTTTAISSITTVSASSGGNITDDGGADVTARGVCWGTATKPEITGSKTSDSKGTGSFTSSITGLTPNTKYYVRAYATNSEGTGYGNEQTFTTNAIVGATVTTTKPGSITVTTAVSGGTISSDGGGAITARGVCWATSASPLATGLHTTDGTGTGSFTSNITGLTGNTTYYVRAYATNSAGTTYGGDEQFKTAPVVPTVTTAAVTNPTQTTATSGGNVTADGGASVTARGVCWTSGTADPVVTDSHTSDGTGTGAFTSSLTQLTPNTSYKARAYATNSAGTGYGAVQPFTTSPVLLATVATTAPSPSSVTATTAVTGGDVTADGGGTITARGVCYGTTQNPDLTASFTTDGTGTGAFTSNLSGLTAGTLYYVRAYATNAAGTAYGTQVQFLTMVSDAEGNLYKTVIIGNQVWMAENLKTKKYNDNSNITPVTDPTVWAGLTSEAYCWYDNDEATNKPIYGALYNWYAVDKGNLCPTGWHVPTDADFMTMEMFLGMTQGQAEAFGDRGTDQGAKLKNTTGWATGENGTNTSGFSALPGGFRYYGGNFWNLGTLTYFWTSSPSSTSDAFQRRLDGSKSTVFRERTLKQAGKYVRCLKN